MLSAGCVDAVGADVLAHRLQRVGEWSECAEARLLAEGCAGLLECIESFFDDLPGGVLVWQYEDGGAGDLEGGGPAVAPGWDGPTGSAVSTGPNLRSTQFMRCLAVRASVSNPVAVSPWWM